MSLLSNQASCSKASDASLPQPQQLADSQARIRAIDPTLSCIVQAPAGSGKTSLLVDRFIALLAETDDPEAIVAITHTRKAASEINARISKTILSPLENLSAQQRTLAAKLTARCARSGITPHQLVTRLRVTTIDGLCQRLARASSYHQLYFAESQTVDQPQVLYRRAAQQVLSRLWETTTDPQLLHVWQHYGCDTEQLENELIELIKKREQWLPHLSSLKHNSDDVLRSCNEGWTRVADAQLQALHQAAGEGFFHNWKRIAQQVLDWLHSCSKDSTKLAAIQCISQKQMVNTRDWWGAFIDFVFTKDGNICANSGYLGFPANSAPTTKAAKDQLKADKEAGQELLDDLRNNQLLVDLLANGLVEGDISTQQRDLLLAISHVAVLTVAELYLIFGQQQQVDFTQVAHGAIDTLTKNPEQVHPIHHLLVDEFQDTSPVQWQLIEHLVSGWDKSNSLFLVGDPMQSIYGFRQAEVALFIRAWKYGIGDVSLQQLNLTSNFRSHPGLVHLVNRIGESIFTTRHHLLAAQVPFVKAHAASTLDGQVEPKLLPSAKDTREIDITTLLAKQPQGTSIAILVQKRTLAASLMAALDTQGIGYSAVDLLQRGEQQHSIDLINLTHLCLEPQHWRHWLGLLRAPQLGAPLELCNHLYNSGSTPIAAIKDYLQSPQQQHPEMPVRLAWLLERIEPTLQMCGLRPLIQVVETLWIELGFEALLTAQARQECHELLRFLHDLSCNTGGWWIDWNEVYRWLEISTSSVVREHSATTPQLDIQIMTCHKAKGLEFDVVILPYADDRNHRGSEKRPLLKYDQITVAGIPSLLMAANADKFFNEKHVNYMFLAKHQQYKEEAELRRLLYVSLTRAKRELIVMGEVPKQHKTNKIFFDWLLTAGCELQQEQQNATQPTAEPQDQQAPPLVLRTQLVNFDQLTSRLPKPHTPIRFSRQRPHPHPNTAIALGTCLHSAMETLHRLATQANFDLIATIETWRDNWRNALAWLGVPAKNIVQAQKQLDTALNGIAIDPQVVWMLQPHSHKKCEWPLIRIDTTQTRVLDLTFYADGYRWIIDYKAIQREEGESDIALMERAKANYGDQLHLYATYLQDWQPTPQPIKLGIYLLLQQLWVEWDGAST